MKFGKYLAARQLEFPEYSGNFINYKALKKLIKALTKDASTPLQDRKGSFFFRLERELEKVNDFYLKKEAELKFRLDILIQKKEQYRHGNINKNSVNFVSLYDGFKKFTKDLDRLEQFVELNETGFTKVLKKWDKRSKSTTKELYLTTAVNVQPVFHRSEIIELSDLAANNLMELENFVDGGTSFSYSESQIKKQIPTESINRRKRDLASSTSLLTDNMKAQEYSELEAFSASGACDELYRDFYEITLQNANLSQDDQIAKLKDWSNQIITKLPDATKKYTLSKVLLLLIPNIHISDESLMRFYQFFKEFIDLKFTDDLNGRTCLIEASTCKRGRNDIVKLMLTPDLDPTAKDVSGRTCLHYVTENGRDDLLHLLLSFSATHSIIDAMDNDSISPLLLAILNDHVDCVQTLLEFGANGFPPQNELKPKYLPLNVACKIGNHEVVKMILERFGSPELAIGKHLLTSSSQCNAEGLLPFHIVASCGHTSLLPLLIEYGADINQLDKLNKWSPLFYAVMEGHVSMTRELISNGADYNVEDDEGCDPLYYAIWDGNISVLNVLLEDNNDNAGCATGKFILSNTQLEKKTKSVEQVSQHEIHAAPSAALKPSLQPNMLPQLGMSIDVIPDLSLPPPIIPLRKYGHNFLEKKIFLKISFYTSRNSIELNSDSFLTSVPGRITISCDKNDLIPRNLLLPVLSSEKTIAFQTDALDDSFNIDFELFPTFGTRLLAKATLPSSLLVASHPGSGSKLGGDLQIPLLDVKLRNTGFLRFNYEIVYPYSGTPLEISLYDTYWKSSSVAEKKTLKNDIQDNTSQLKKSKHQNTNVSFVTASSLTGIYHTVHVYVLNDGTPIVCPDYLVKISDNVSLPVCCFNFGQLSDLLYKDTGGYESICDRLKHMNSHNGAELHQVLKKLYMPLSMFLDAIDPEFALNLEIFYPSVYEMEFYDIKLFTSVSSKELIHKCNIEEHLNTSTDNCLNNFIDLILTDIFNHVRTLRHNGNTSRSRSLILSSDNSTVCTILNWKQPNYPVFYNLSGIKLNKKDGRFYECTANGFSKKDRIVVTSSKKIEEETRTRKINERSNLLIDNIDSINKDSSEYVSSLHYQDKLSRSTKLATDFACTNNLLGVTVPRELLQICPKVAQSIRSKGLILVASRDQYDIGETLESSDLLNDDSVVNGVRYNNIISFKDTIDM
ncbi:hypothetical protein BRETT_000048 [Brettanomyces bruxellensis]|uniref:Phosphate system positive regulatory protein PHO81 n=1 Tax=Dekkera bruxellensis TaxID=5007 RepID=A0A871R0C2_DEKBR|nr:uncharacterized protein BRETT_000048 [Brettanomyces bruxellensis]QOU18326.1 hypothetical protein BRETT_000048 [Brettanomyces bruxellensis]